MTAAGLAPAGSATLDLDPAELMTVHAEAVGAVRAAVETWVPGDGGMATACPEWTSHELLLHLACTARRYHRILDDALAGEPQPLVLDDDLADLNRRELAASDLRGLPAHLLLEVFADSATYFADRALHAWGSGPFQRDGVDVGPAVVLAAIEWHVHAWDLRRALGRDHYPPHAELLRQGWALTVPHLGIDQDGDPWTAVLLAAGREAPRPSGASGVTVRESGVAGLDRGEWDRVAPSFYQTHAWLRAEAGTTDEPVTVLTANQNGLVGGLTLYGSFDVDTGAPIPEVAPLLAGGPLLRVGGLRGYSADVAAGPGPMRDEVAGALLAHSRTLARERGCRDVVLLWATEQAVRTARASIPASPPLLLAADVSLPVPPGGFEGFLRSRARRRRSVLQEEGRFARAGLRVKRTTLEESWELCAPLLGALQDKYGQGQPESYWRDMLASMAETLPGSVVYLAINDEGPVAFVLAYPSSGGVTVRAAGFDYSRIPREGAVYANLVVHQMVRHAAEHGLDAVHLGKGGYPAKVQRGGRVELLFALAGEDAGIAPAAAHSHNEQVLQRLREEFGSHQEPLDAAVRRNERRGWL